ncbi:hypothetical protein DFJ75_3078 [Williamsia muralis]|uniref:Uncharacterized protein n=1 Tax=Williamsia marianensis TaxID=85044 RepID=A0A495K4N7_WILMA|nr:hypothetical protein DFJ75_3078 [Williamsia muralis]
MSEEKNPSEAWRSERSRFASLSRSRHPRDPDVLAARQKMASLKWLADVEALAAKAPALSEEQRDRIAGLLLSGGGK